MKKNCKLNFGFLLFFSSSFLACNHQEKQNNEVVIKDKKEFQEKMIRSHQAYLKKENDRIEHYIDSLNKPFKTTGTGLRYHIEKSNGQGEEIKSGDLVFMTYLLNNLEGDTLYQSPENHLQEFRVDYESVESGLHEGIKYLKTGETATLILPAHLAHGVTGDQAAIGPQTTLVYQLTVHKKE